MFCFRLGGRLFNDVPKKIFAHSSESLTQKLDLYMQKDPRFFRTEGLLRGKPSNVLLSLEIQPTIIGAKAFHCPVRNGKEWDHLAMVAWLSLLLKSSSLSNEFFTVNKALSCVTSSILVLNPESATSCTVIGSSLTSN